jgi:hypothetical protein
MTDREPLDRFCAIVGPGKVYGPYKTRKTGARDKGKWAPNYSWQAHGETAMEVAALLFPYLCTRRLAKLADILQVAPPSAFLPADVIQMFGEYMHRHRTQADGQLRDPDNWKRGIPLDSYISSAWRHLQDVWLHHEGRSDLAREGLEEALCALLFNVQGYLHELLLERDVAE